MNGIEQIWLVTFDTQATMVVLAPDGVEAGAMSKRVAHQLNWPGKVVKMEMLQSAGFGVIAGFRSSEDLFTTTDFAGDVAASLLAERTQAIHISGSGRITRAAE